MKKYFWFSFSYERNNQGVILVEAENSPEAHDKLLNLKCVPNFDDIAAFEIEEAEIELNVLVSPETLISMGYTLNNGVRQ